ncbi:MAG: UbiA-like polyprenyltransferase, partial [Pirellulales bacterium]
MLRTIRYFLELIRFSHTIFALPFALLAAVMAWQLAPFRWQQLLGILLSMATARSFAMAANRLADRKLDAANPRTAGRHLPAGILSVASVAAFAAASAMGFVAATLLFLPNRLPLYLSVPVLAFLAGYSYTKRFTSLAHFWLGAALALSPVAAWIAIRGDAVLAEPADLLPPLVLGGAVLSWVAGFDIIYACQDYESDAKAKLHSVPVRLGVSGALRLAAACHVVTIAFLAALPLVYPPLG